MFETKAGVLLIGGLGFFLFAFLSNAVVPILLYRHMPEQTVQQLVEKNETSIRHLVKKKNEQQKLNEND